MELPYRVFGLDLMRATAIVLVVFWHNYELIRELAPGFSAPYFVDGVDLFFVLSGYLIGGILMKTFDRAGMSRWQRFMGFWRRRFYRTLPNYYLFLLVNIALAVAGVREGLINVNALAYFALMHNLWKPFSLFFWESWSLVVEVWFYLAFPIVAATLKMLLGSLRRGLLAAAALFVTVPFLLRWGMAPRIETLQQMIVQVREIGILRMDAVAFGLLAALAHDGFPRVWHRWRWPLFIAGVAGAALVAFRYGADDLAFSATWNYTLSPLAMALLLPVLSSWATVPRGAAWVTRLSLLAYALFLVHMPVRALLLPYYDPSEPLIGWLQVLFYLLCCTVLAELVYRFYERPLTELRERVPPR